MHKILQKSTFKFSLKMNLLFLFFQYMLQGQTMFVFEHSGVSRVLLEVLDLQTQSQCSIEDGFRNHKVDAHVTSEAEAMIKKFLAWRSTFLPSLGVEPARMGAYCIWYPGFEWHTASKSYVKSYFMC